MNNAVQATERLQSILPNPNLEKLCDMHGLHVFVNNYLDQRGLVSGLAEATLLEAIIRAVAQDGGLKAVRSVMETLGLLAATTTRSNGSM